MALIGILAVLASAGGMLFPPVQDAAAQRSHSGYTYTQRVCQEYGQQPRHYQVRDPIPGSDWRRDGGWAIILITSGHTGIRFHPYDVWLASRPIIEHQGNGVAKEKIIEFGTGVVGFVRLTTLGVPYISPQRVVIDRNHDDQIDHADRFEHPQGGLYWVEKRVAGTVHYGATYIRWANMQWCR